MLPDVTKNQKEKKQSLHTPTLQTPSAGPIFPFQGACEFKRFL